MAVPMRAEVRRQDRPGHVGEAAGEERRGQLDDVMLRLEPGDVSAISARGRFRGSGQRRASCARRDARPWPSRRPAPRPDRSRLEAGRDGCATATAGDRAGQSARGSRCRIAILRQFDEFCGYVEGAVRRFERRRRVGSNSSGSSPCTRQVTSDGFTSFSASVRAALRQPSKSVSLSRVMKCMLILSSTPSLPSEAKQSTSPHAEDVDCFVASPSQ